MAETIELSVTSIQAANNNNESRRVELTPWDLQLLLVGSMQKGILFHRPPSWEQTTMISSLKNSLSRTLEIFTPLAGRLATTTKDDGKISYYIDCNNAGALFVHAVANGVTISDILKPIYVPKIVHSLFPLNEARNYEGTFKPLLAVQVTELIDGIFIGCTLNHVAGDGTSFWNFFNTWAQISRGSDCITQPPVLRRWFLEGIEHPIGISTPCMKLQNGNTHMQIPTLKERVFHFTKENIGKLKAKANAEMGSNRISSLQALLAHLWRSVVRNQKIESNQDVHFRFLIGARQRLHLELSELYFGNAVQPGTVTMKAGELLKQGIGYAAMQMNKMVAMHTQEKLKDFLESWVENPKIVIVGDMAKNTLFTSSSPRFDVYGNDFGWGRPIAVRSGLGNKHEGKITLFSGSEQGSVDIEVCHVPKTLEGMGHDAEFMDAISYY